MKKLWKDKEKTPTIAHPKTQQNEINTKMNKPLPM